MQAVLVSHEQRSRNDFSDRSLPGWACSAAAWTAGLVLSDHLACSSLFFLDSWNWSQLFPLPQSECLGQRSHGSKCSSLKGTRGRARPPPLDTSPLPVEMNSQRTGAADFYPSGISALGRPNRTTLNSCELLL